MIERFYVVISRLPGQPEITVHVRYDEHEQLGMEVCVSLEAFLASVVQHAGSPATLLTRAALGKRLTQAARLACEDVKQETARVM